MTLNAIASLLLGTLAEDVAENVDMTMLNQDVRQNRYASGPDEDFLANSKQHGDGDSRNEETQHEFQPLSPD